MLISLKNLKKGDYFTLKQCDSESVSESVVWVRGDYDRSLRKYSCFKFSDVCHEIFLSPSKLVNVGFTF